MGFSSLTRAASRTATTCSLQTQANAAAGYAAPVSCTKVTTFRNPYKWVTAHFTVPRRVEGWVDLVDCCVKRIWYVMVMPGCAYRTTQLDLEGCRGVHGYYIIEPSGRSCYYNECPGFMASNNRCYRYRQRLPALKCNNGFFEHGLCYYNDKPWYLYLTVYKKSYKRWCNLYM